MEMSNLISINKIPFATLISFNLESMFFLPSPLWHSRQHATLLLREKSLWHRVKPICRRKARNRGNGRKNITNKIMYKRISKTPSCSNVISANVIVFFNWPHCFYPALFVTRDHGGTDRVNKSHILESTYRSLRDFFSWFPLPTCLENQYSRLDYKLISMFDLWKNSTFGIKMFVCKNAAKL